MHDPFDPYWQWLAIPPAEQPPDHYRLLGLKVFESDSQIIARAVQLRIEHVRACDDGVHGDSVERVLQHVAAARDTLLNPRLKTQYDNLLSQKQPTQGPASAQPSTFAAPAAFQPQSPSGKKGAAPGVGTIREQREQRERWRALWMWLAACGGVAGLVVVLGLMLSSFSRGKPAEAPSSVSDGRGREQVAGRSGRRQAPPPSSSSRPTLAASADQRGRRRPSPERAGAPRPRGPQTMADLMREADDTAIDPDTVTGKLAAARRAMWSRDLDAARRHVEEAIEAARTSTERTEVERVHKLLKSLEAFWTAVRQAAGRLESGRELRVGETMVMVVEADGGSLTIRAAGQNRTYRVEDLPPGLAITLARQALPKGQSATDLHLGSFLAIDARGDRHDARAHWDRAGPDGKALLIELTLAPAVQAAASEEPMRSGVMDPGTLNDAPLPGQPDASADPRVRRPVQRASVPDAFCRAIDEMDRRYQIDALGMKAEAVTEAWRSHDAASCRAALAERSLTLLDAAMTAKHYAAAEQFVRVAQHGARASKNHALLRELEDRARQIRASQRGDG